MPADSVEYWGNLGLRIRDEGYLNAGMRAQSLAFTIDGVSELWLLQKFKEAIGEGLDDGMTVGEVRQLLRERLDEGVVTDGCVRDSDFKKALVAAREFKELFAGNKNLLDSVISSCMARAESAGLWREMQRAAASDGRRRLVHYTLNDDKGVCSGHRALDGLVRPHDDTVWQDCWPPNGPGCTCEAHPLFEARAAKKRLHQTPDSQASGILEEVRRSGSMFPSVEHHLLPFADALTKKFKAAENTVEQHMRNSVEWACHSGLDEALIGRFKDGVDSFAVDSHSASSRGEMSIDIAVLPSHMPRHLSGQVIVVTDTGYKEVFRELLDRKDFVENDLLRRKTRTGQSAMDRPQNAIEILKRVHYGWSVGNSIAVSASEFFVCADVGDIWIGFKFKEDRENGTHYYQMFKAIHAPDLRQWLRDRGKGRKETEIIEIKKGPGNTPDLRTRDG